MNFSQIDPPVATFERWRGLRSHGRGLSILRALEYETLGTIDLSGRVLDFGGGRRASYFRKLPDDCEVLSVNIDTQFEPTHIVPPGDPLPFEDDGFDAVLTLNTLEHVYDDIGTIRELVRVTRSGGRLHIMVPFLFRVHGHPDDYNRHTPSWWAETLDRAGCTSASLLPLVFGRRTTAQMVAGGGGGRLRPLVTFGGALRDILAAKVMFPGKTVYAGGKADNVWHRAPGWYIEAVK
ncbi:methyltransferase domain-containing protein [Rhodobacterales bacterium HKCCE2091]|nr:methyltransferase domain-containing protein [Rhodobacterales bacterium HKCCE2091]